MDKGSLRRKVLAATKAASVESRLSQSTQLSHRILEHLQLQYVRCNSNPAVTNCANIHPSMSKPLVICSFLPMYFEPDLMKVFSGLWEQRESGGGGALPIRTAVPHMISPSEMLFVEVKNEKDLLDSFAPQGKWKIVELQPDILSNTIISAGATAGDQRGGGGNDDAAARLVIGATNQQKRDNDEKGPSTNTTSPSPPSLNITPFISTTTTASAASVNGYDLVILCPVAGLDVEGRRLGKGAGYYDRFIEGVTNTILSLQPKLPFSSSETLPVQCELIGVALNEQVLEVGVIPMDEHDQWLHTVVTPTSTLRLRDTICRKE